MWRFAASLPTKSARSLNEEAAHQAGRPPVATLKTVELEVELTSQLASMASQRILPQTSFAPPQPTPPTLQMDLLPGCQAAKFRGNSK